ncbi:uncharacterized protein An12g05790 [Aspergillus niger]|uniref:Contig An12c0160, genomic contig n=2 Tax=Aspergillus niger TaxID=5061 RepID=A2QZQ5_ASPNC|nr:uncharacterized protein An12g05790 [Aspergillus niger]CAK46287.1 unnamed protein product [Aspergillus niger]
MVITNRLTKYIHLKQAIYFKILEITRRSYKN